MAPNTNKFKIEKLFEKVKYKKLPFKAGDLKNVGKSNYTIPVLSAGIDNQGLAYYAPKENATILKNVISVSANGANSGAMFYQPYDFTVLQDSYAIKFKGKELNENEYLYLLTSLQKIIRNNYNWTNKAGWERIKLLEIELPVNESGEIDFNYMDSFISRCKADYVNKINTKLIDKGLGNNSITEEEKNAKFDYFSSAKKTKKVKTKTLFKVVYNNSLDKSAFNFNDNGQYPYFTRTIFDNGIAGYVDYLDEEHKINGNSIAVGLLQMQFFYMEKDFYAGQFTKTIFPLFQGFNENIGLFFATLFNKQSEYYKSVLVRDFDKVFLESEIEIPVNDDGDLDLRFIDKFISVLKKETLNKVSLQ